MNILNDVSDMLTSNIEGVLVEREVNHIIICIGKKCYWLEIDENKILISEVVVLSGYKKYYLGEIILKVDVDKMYEIQELIRSQM